MIEQNEVDIRNQGTLFTLGHLYLFLWQRINLVYSYGNINENRLITKNINIFQKI